MIITVFLSGVITHYLVLLLQVLPLAEELFTQLKAEGTLSALICLRSLSEVFQCLTSHFSTVPVPGVVLQYVTVSATVRCRCVCCLRACVCACVYVCVWGVGTCVRATVST